MDLTQRRDDLAANEPPHGLVVRAVPPKRKVFGATVALGLVSPDRQKRANDPVVAPDPDPRRRPARRQSIDDGLDLIRSGVAGSPQSVRRDRVTKLAELLLAATRGRRRLDDFCVEAPGAEASV